MGRTVVKGLGVADLRLLLEYYRALGLSTVCWDAAVPSPGPVHGAAEKAKQHLLRALREDSIGECTRCRLSEGRSTIVFGEGSPDSEIMFIGEGPGEEEDRQGRPFVGRAGQVLRSLIRKMGLDSREVYIANIVKCRPPGNRTPLAEEIETCIEFLKQQITIISPRVIILLGNVALQGLMKTGMRISAARGTFMEYEGIPVMPTFHPSYLLRNPKDKWLTWQDAVTVLRHLGRDTSDMPVERGGA